MAMMVFHVFKDGTVVLPISGGLGGSKGQPTSSTVVEKSSIPEEFLPFFTRLFEQGEAASKQISDQPFPGQLTPSVQPLTFEALAGQEAIARSLFGGGGLNVPGGIQINPDIGFQALQAPTTFDPVRPNPEFERIQALIAGTAPTISTPASGTDPAQNAGLLSSLQSQLAAAQQGVGIIDVSGEGNALGLENEQARVDRIKAQIAGLSADQTPFVPASTTENPALVALQEQLANISPTLSGSPAGPEAGPFPSTGQVGPGQATIDLGRRFAAGDFLDIRNNEPLRNAIQATIDPVFRQFTDIIGPSINSAAFEAGAVGGSRESGALAQAAQRALDSALNISAQITLPEFQRQQALQIAAPEIIASGVQGNLLPFGLLESVAQQKRALEQEKITEAVARFQEQNAAPFRPLEPLSALFTGANLGTDVTKNISNQFAQPGLGSQLFAGALGGLNLFNAASESGLLAGLSGLFGGSGIADIAGGAGGALGGSVIGDSFLQTLPLLLTA